MSDEVENNVLEKQGYQYYIQLLYKHFQQEPVQWPTSLLMYLYHKNVDDQ